MSDHLISLEKIEIQGAEYSLVALQRSGIKVFRGPDTFARVGSAAAVDKSLAVHQHLDSLAFPVAKIKSRGDIPEGKYFVEESLGNERCRDIFAREYESLGEISSAEFSKFLTVSEEFFRAQLQTIVARDEKGFESGVKVDRMVSELPKSADLILEKVKAAQTILADTPYVLSHGDFNPSNILPRGVIDFEDTFIAPFGYDAATNIVTIEWFPHEEGFEFIGKYSFTGAQKNEYTALVDTLTLEKGIPAFSKTYPALAFMRALWMSGGMTAWPKIQAWRFEKLIALLEL